MRNPYFILGIAVLIFIGLIIYFVPTQTPHMEQSYMPENLFTIESTGIGAEGKIGREYTCDAAAPVSLPLVFKNIPEGTKSLALIVIDPDVPKQLRPDGEFVHWVLFNILPTTTEIPEGTSAGVEGGNGRGTAGYVGPCPPPQYEPKEHRYFFTLYALDTNLDLPTGASKEQVLGAIEGHELGSATLIGRYSRTE